MKVWQHGKDCLHVEYGDRQIAPEKCYGRDCGGSWMQLVPADAGQKVWWCEEHLKPSDNADAEQCYETDWIPCRMVRAWLTVEAPEEPPKDPWDYDP